MTTIQPVLGKVRQATTDIVVDGERNAFGAWYYPEPKEGSVERVKKDFANYVAFWNGVEVTE